MEWTEQGARSRPRRSVKKDKVIGCRKKSVVRPVSFKLHTELLAEKRKQQREEKEIVQLRRTQQKIMGKKTIEDFAQPKLIRRETAATRSRSLHCNGTGSKPSGRGKEYELLKMNEQVPESTVHVESRPLMSARLSSPLLASNSLPQRPQSAKSIMQSQRHHNAGFNNNNEGTDYRDPKMHPLLPTKKKRKKKTNERKAGRLTPSKSTPALPDRAKCSHNSPTCKKINIIVNMRNLQLAEEQETPFEASPPVISRGVWG